MLTTSTPARPADARALTGAEMLDLAPLLELLPLGIALFDADERLILCNDKYRNDQDPKVRSQIVPGLTFTELLDVYVRQDSFRETEGGADAWRRERFAAFRSGHSERVIHRAHLGWYHVQDVRLANGHTMIIGTELGGVKEHSKQIDHVRQRLTDYLNVASDWFWETDANHRFTFISERIEEAVGIAPGEFIGRDRREMAFKSQDSEEWAAHISDLEAHRPFRNFRYSVASDRGGLLFMSTSGQPIFAADGSFAGYRGTAFNATREVEGQRASDRFLEAIESVSDGYALWDKDDKLIVCNNRWREMNSATTTLPIGPGLEFEAFLRDNVANNAFPSLGDDAQSWIRERLRRRRSNSPPFEQARDGGRWLRIQERCTPDGGVLQILSDISALKRRELALRESEERFKGFAESAADWFWELDEDFRITFLSARYEQLTGKAISELIGGEFSLLSSSDDAHQKSIAAAIQILRDGHILHDHEIHAASDNTATVIHSLGGQAVRDANGEILGYRGTGRDVTQARLLSTQLAHQASHDELTGLVNRRGFEQRLARAMESVQSGRGQYALCYLDLDRFKVVNDSCGHAAGDELLRQLSGVLQNKVRGRDTVARFGGDEFALLLENCSLDEARPIAETLRSAIEAFEFIWIDQRFRLGASIGIVMLRTDTTLVELMRAADSACYTAKELGRNRVHVYEPDDEEQSRRERELDWVARINEALSEDRFTLYAQLIRESKPDGETVHRHFEILIRMRSRDGELIAPGAFLPAAERFGLATRIDRWVVRQAFDLLEQSPHLFEEGGFLSINLSGQSLSDEDFCAYVLHQLRTRAVLHQLRTRAIRGAQICFEITETAAIADLSAAKKLMRETAQLGCHFALDDFGTGLSSFAYLRDLPVDFVKIDGAFIKDIEIDPIHRAMVRSIHEIASVLGKKTIAEFVSNDTSAELLAEIGVDYVQGFGIAEPVPLHELLGG